MTESQTTPRFLEEPLDIALSFHATEEAVRHTLERIRNRLNDLNIDELNVGLVEIVLAEVSNNIVEHAYRNTGNGCIHLKCCLGAGLLQFEIIDEGFALPDEALPLKRQHDLGADLDDLPEGGFGWGLIRDVTQYLAYRRSNGRNILRFSIPVATKS